MCGRYYIAAETSGEIEKILRDIDSRNLSKNYKTGEIFPTNTVPILVSQQERITPHLCVWGFPDFKNKGVIINARSETAFEKKTFRESLLSRRCIIPANGFYEWNRSKEKIYFTQPQSCIIYMAGIYNIFGDERRFVILTTNANESIVDIHNRMPLILQKDQISDWLNDNAKIQSFLKHPSTLLNRKLNYEQLGLRFS